MHNLVFVAENGKPRRTLNRLQQFRSRRIHVNPNVTVAFFTGKMPSKNALHFQLVLTRKRRNLNALPAASIKPPPVITTLPHVPIQPPIRQRYPPVRARIPHRKRFPLGGSAEHQRHFQQHPRHEPLPPKLRAPHPRLPENPQKTRLPLSPSFLRYLGLPPHPPPYPLAHDPFS